MGQFVAEPQHLCLVGDIAGVAGDQDAGPRGGVLGQRGGRRGGVGIQVAGRD